MISDELKKFAEVLALANKAPSALVFIPGLNQWDVYEVTPEYIPHLKVVIECSVNDKLNLRNEIKIREDGNSTK